VKPAAAGSQNTVLQPRPEPGIDARRRAAGAKVTAVEKAIKALGRTGAPLTRMVVSRLAGVSRSFTYENDTANRMIAAAQVRSQARAEDRIETRTV
jgi:hypothetical protein